MCFAQSDFSPYLDIVTDELNLLYWEGVPVQRAGCHDTFSCRAMVLNIISDYRGIPEIFRVAQSPAFNGACYICKQEGWRMTEESNKTIYPGKRKTSVVSFSFHPTHIPMGAGHQNAHCRVLEMAASRQQGPSAKMLPPQCQSRRPP